MYGEGTVTGGTGEGTGEASVKVLETEKALETGTGDGMVMVMVRSVVIVVRGRHVIFESSSIFYNLQTFTTNRALTQTCLIL